MFGFFLNVPLCSFSSFNIICRWNLSLKEKRKLKILAEMGNGYLN